MKNIYLLIFCLQIFSNVHAGFRDGPIPVTASEANPIGGGYAKSLLYFDCTNADRKIRKPLIVFEGFDPGYYTEPKDKEGRSGIQFFLDEIENDKLIGQPSQLEILLRGNPNASPLIVQEYDIVYVNWVNGTDYLQNNEKVAKEVIKHVNYLKTLSGSTEPNVIIGRSMGSIIARMALKNMENELTADANKPRHQTRLFISNDGGQQGSNIPQGHQHLANHFKSLYIRTGPVALAIEGASGTVNSVAEDLNFYRRVGSPDGSLSVNQTPASKQLAINHVDASNDIDNTKHYELITALNTLGYPQGDGNQTFKMIAVSNGSECAQPQPVGSGGSLLNYTGTISTTFLTSILANVSFATLGAFTGGVSFSAFSFPPLIAMGTIPGTDHFNIELKVNAKANNVGNEVYKGKINYIKKVMTVIPVAVPITNRSYNASAGTLAYDYFPGGSQDLVSDLPLPEPGNDYFLERDIVFNHQPYCHVPIPSALDIGQGAVALTFADYFMPYQGAVPPTGSKSSAFPAFITAFNISGPDNEGHTQISRRNGDWLAAELNGTGTLSPNCAFACNGGTISGDATFCTTSGNYSIPNLPAGATVVWTISPPRAVTINSPNATQTTLTKVNNGPITLTATISSDCGANVVIQKEIYVGPEPVNVLGAFDPTYHTIMGEVCVGDPYYFVAGDPVSPNPLNTYTWTHFPPPGSPNSISLYSGANLNITFIEPGMHTLRVTKTNNCGEVITNRVIEVLDCFNFMYYSISPNPASSTINIGVNTKNTSQNRKVEPGSLNIDEVKIYDASGFLRLQQKCNKQQSVTINTSALTNGLYRVEISHAGKVERQQLLINR